jgi:riboflavin synthase
MFTGIIKAIGTIEALRPRDGDLRISVGSAGLDWSEYRIGESIAVNGACLTAAKIREGGFEADVSNETMRATTLGALRPGSRVNLEPAMRLDERLGGHLVSGHVDCVGTVVERRDEGRSVRLAIELPAEYRRYVAAKGSVCVDGVSLTVNEVAGRRFGVNIVPHTAEHTVAGEWREGSKVNIEVDLVARYLERLLETQGEGGLSREFLQEHGYA